MTKKMIEKRIIVYEIVGFCLIIILLWADEIFDIPYHLFGAQATPINWIESIIETMCILILGILIIAASLRFMSTIKYLEGFLPVCAYCKKIRVGDNWIPIEVYISNHSAAVFSHGYCPECKKKYDEKYLE